MKYQQKQFNTRLRDNIQSTEKKLESRLENVKNAYTSDFVKINLVLDADFDKEGIDPFTPGYRSAISIGISDETEELIDLHVIKIWECDRYFLGMPTSRNLPGSKVAGELIEETPEEVKKEIHEYIKEILNSTDE
ncbi:hypothetical protein [Bacillus marinisedimentorum]|uniref:hypothetical protein n=1 Tax=Bacillus marinisedimentorum TaxID=1821260 RepID=UPI0007E1D952|nr:hypothetical protein [Bacillus marinisedimentorum]